MSDPKNPNKNKVTDASNNINLHITNDSSNNEVINPLFLLLQDSKENKNRLLLTDTTTNKEQRDIKGKSLYFNMKFNTVLEGIRKNREDNENEMNKNLSHFTKSFDNSSNLVNKKDAFSIVPFKPKNKTEMNSLLNKINDKYNLICGDPSKIIKKKKPTFPPPPPPPRRKPTKKDAFTSPLFVRGNRANSWSFNPTNAPKSKDSWTGWDSNIWAAPKPPPPPGLPPSLHIPPPIHIKKTKVIIDREIDGLQDILNLIEDYPLKPDVEYNINMHTIHNIKKPLEELNNMIGMNKLKDSIVDQIVYFAQDLHKGNDFMHTVIYGPPGTGKTEVAKIMGKIFSSIGILTNRRFRKVTRADLIAGYLGQTAIKTRDVIKDCLGGVLFIDEAYALGNPEKRDSFAKECIDTLCEGLSDHKSKLMVIVAGYEKDLNKCFFAYNQGLDSRFPWRFHTDDYKGSELNLIFQKKIKDIDWTIKEPLKDSWFDGKMDYFKYYGRDMETLLAKTKIAHGRRVFCKSKSEKKVITMRDIEKGFEMFTDNNEVKERGSSNSILPHMYI